MSHVRSSRRSGVCALALVAGALTLAPATPGVAAQFAGDQTSVTGAQWCPVGPAVSLCYEMNDTDGSMSDSAGPLFTSVTQAVRTDGTVRAGAVRSAEPDSLFFSGWLHDYDTTTGALKANTAADRGLDAYASEVRVDVTESPEQDRLNPPASNGVPGAGPWTLGLRLRPRLVVGSGEPAGTAPHLPYQPTDCAVRTSEGCPALDPSYNVLQRGRWTTEGGAYKLEVMGYDGTEPMPFRSGAMHCTFIDDDGTRVEAFSDVTVTKSQMYDVLCSRHGSTVNLDVRTWGEGVHRSTGHVTEPGADGVLDSVRPGTAADPTARAGVAGSVISVGKKVDSENYGDAFAGWIDSAYLAGSSMRLCQGQARPVSGSCG